MAPVRIVINGRFLTQTMTGVQRYARELVQALDRMIGTGLVDTGRFSLAMVTPAAGVSNLALKHIPVRATGRLGGHLWEQVELPWASRGALLLNLCNTGPAFKRRQTVTIHDAAVHAVPQGYGAAFRFWYKALLPVLGRAAEQVFTVSQFSHGELARHYRIPSAKCVVIGEGHEHVNTVPADPAILARHGLAGKRFLLAVSSMNPNKNFGAVVKAIEQLREPDFAFVVAGGANPAVFQAAGATLPPFVRHLGYVTDGELRALYEAAACFVYPSIYEGFGLPPLEAMASGCPVICSDAASLPEVCGDAVLYCDPARPDTLATQIERVMASEALRADLSRRGRERALQFTWERCARETWSVIEEVASR